MIKLLTLMAIVGLIIMGFGLYFDREQVFLMGCALTIPVYLWCIAELFNTDTINHRRRKVEKLSRIDQHYL